MLVDERPMGADVKRLNHKFARIDGGCRRDCTEIILKKSKHESKAFSQKTAPLLNFPFLQTWVIDHKQGETVTKIDAISEKRKDYWQSFYDIDCSYNIEISNSLLIDFDDRLYHFKSKFV